MTNRSQEEWFDKLLDWMCLNAAKAILGAIVGASLIVGIFKLGIYIGKAIGG